MGAWLDLSSGDSFWPVTKGSTYYFEVSVSSARTIDDVRTWLLNEGWQLASVQASSARQGQWLTWDVIATWTDDSGTVSDRPGVAQYFQRYLWQPAGAGDVPSASQEPATVETGTPAASTGISVGQAAPVVLGGLALGGLLGWLYWSA